jgi:hypothetical protein
MPSQTRTLPGDLTASLHRARAVEHAAVTRPQRLAAVHATTMLILAARQEGWTISELAPPLDLSQVTVRRRIDRARHRPAAHGLTIPPAPPPSDHVAPPLPVEEREWLTVHEASALAGVAPRSLSQWWRAGLMPATHRAGKHRLRYSRTDLERIMTARRDGAFGVSWPVVRAAIADGTESLHRRAPDR